MRPGRRRDKVQMSCTCCRARKVKCDRNHPCQNCTKRGQAGTCTYLNASTYKRAGQPSTSSEAASMRQRVIQLERLLRSFIAPSDAGVSTTMDSQASASQGVNMSVNHFGVSDSSEESTSDGDMSGTNIVLDRSCPPLGRISLENAETNYVGSAHWAAVLDEVVELKDILDTHNSLDENSGGQMKNQEPDLLFSANQAITQAEILASIPSKDVVDRLISRYFSSMDMAPVFLHVPTFQQEYGHFWVNPWGAPIMWLGVLFSMMCMAEHFCLAAEDKPPGPPHKSQYMIQKYREKAAQCLVLGNYTKPTDYTLEALLLYLTTEQIRSNDTQFGISILVGIIVRSAMRMGYHRDPSHYPNISVFHAEMRRRIWSTVVVFDILTSFQVGLPKLINESQVDSELPRNLLDEDFDQHAVELPPPRPDTECTLMSYAIMKHRLTSVFGMIANQATSTQTVSYADDVMRLDKLLYEVYGSVPPGLRMRPTANSVTDSSALIVRRFALEVFFQKSRCVLHRRYLVLARSNQRYLYSRRSCVDAAMQLLGHQSVLHNECQLGGLLHRDRWKILPLMSQAFLLAAMIICLEFDHLIPRSQDVHAVSEEVSTEESMLQVLQRSYSIWSESAASSTEALRVSAVLKMMLQKVTPTANDKDPDIPTKNHADPSAWPAPASSSGRSKSPQSPLKPQPGGAYPYLGDDLLGLPLNQQFDANQILLEDPFALPNAAIMENMIYSPTNLDWGIWDTCI